MRVKAVVGRSIMVALADVRPNDILWAYGDERDAIIETIEFKSGHYRFIYKEREPSEIQKKMNITPVVVSNWMNPEEGNGVFIHDLMNERAEFDEG